MADLPWSTPAHAGNTADYVSQRVRRRVYPRPRGEYNTANRNLATGGGLPPPTRGIPSRSATDKTLPGSTPAHAGNTARNR